MKKQNESAQPLNLKRQQIADALGFLLALQWHAEFRPRQSLENEECSKTRKPSKTRRSLQSTMNVDTKRG